MNRKVLAGRTILIIDDDYAVATVVQQALEYAGCRVVHGATGEKGLELAESEPVELVVLDVSLPKIDGFGVCKRLKENPVTREIPVLFLSAINETKERVRGLRLGAIDYVVKPFDIDELIERIDIGLRVKVGSPRAVVSEDSFEESPSIATHAESKRKSEILSNEIFLAKLENRFQKLDPENGLLTLAFIRVDQEEHLMGEEHTEIRGKILETVFEVLSDLCPEGTLLGKLNSFQVGVLIPRKNKYGAELILDELSNLLNLKDFHSENDFPRLTLSCGVAEVPSTIIASAKEFEEMANSALHRAKQSGGDRTVLL